MQFHFALDGSLVAMCMFSVAIVIVVGLGRFDERWRYDSVSEIVSSIAKRSVVWIVTSLVIANVVVAIGSSLNSSIPGRTMGRTISAELGLVSGQEYPLVMGSRFGGSTAEAEADSGIFSANAQVSTQPASTVSLGFTVDEKSYILEIPVSKITFIQSESASPYVELTLNDASDDATAWRESPDIGCRFHNLLFTCVRLEDEQKTPLRSSTVRKGLPPIVNEYLDTAVIMLTPAMYKDVLGLP